MRLEIEKRTREKKEMEHLTLEMEYEYSHDLVNYLDKVHLQLVKACAFLAKECLSNQRSPFEGCFTLFTLHSPLNKGVSPFLKGE